MTKDSNELPHHKLLEINETSRKALSSEPLVVARLDIVAAHTLTKSLPRPFSDGFIAMMDEVAKYLVQRTGALFAYTQSDEITLVFKGTEKHPIVFNGKFHKLTSVFASMASVKATQCISAHLPELSGKPVLFDCRAFEVDSVRTVVDVLQDRMSDARNNAVLMVCQSLYSHQELHNTSFSDMIRMLLFEHGMEYTDIPSRKRDGGFFAMKTVEQKFTHDELQELSEKHHARSNPDLVVRRKKVTNATYSECIALCRAVQS